MTTVPKLNDQFSPSKYQLSLDLTAAGRRKFRGTVTITGVSKIENSISLHAKDLTIESALIDGKSAKFSSGEFDELKLTQDGLTLGKHIAVVSFSGEITDAMHGLYPCYFEHDGVKKELFATQFESHHAREVFPCVDEPAAKAEFDLTLTTEQDLTVLGNMPIKQQKTENGALVTNFDTSPKMSSYLLAFVVGELHKKTAQTKSGVEVNIWATPAQAPETLDFALDITTRSIDFFDEYFGVPYPLPKADHVALPDFSSGAMENWGLITYRESCLLADKFTPISSRRFIATVIAHELSHQWFGNLVTMQWWNDLWLNESFANLMEYVAIDALQPEWRIWEDFALNEVAAAITRDSLDGVQAVKTEVNHPDEISMLFDGAIVYAKGARLLRMVHQLIGEEAFRRGLQSYFDKFAYQNTVGDDLWRELELSSGQNILQLMNMWISNPGLPMVTVEKSNDGVKLSQQRFFVGEHHPSDTIWPIPLFAEPQLTNIFDQPNSDFTVNGDVRINCGLRAHFISKYDHDLLTNILKNTDQLPTLDKICLLQDNRLLARAGEISSSELLGLGMAFRDETNEKVLELAALNLKELRKFVEDEPEAERHLRQKSYLFASETINKLGWDERSTDSDDEKERRSIAAAMALYSESPTAITEAKQRFDINNFQDLPAELRSLFISANVRHFETPELVDQLLKIYQTTTSNDLQADIAAGLTSTKKPETIARLLDAIKNPDIIRPQDASRWFVYLVRGRESRAQAWQWLKDNWHWVEKTFAGDKSYDDFVRYTGTALMTADELADFSEFFSVYADQPALKRTIELAIKEISARVKLIKRDKAAVIDILSRI